MIITHTHAVIVIASVMVAEVLAMAVLLDLYTRWKKRALAAESVVSHSGPSA